MINQTCASLCLFLFFNPGWTDRGKTFQEIKSEYETVYQTYPENKCIKVSYLSILGNLIRVNHELGNKRDKEKYAEIWFSKKTKRVEKWLPKSLLEDLKRFES